MFHGLIYVLAQQTFAYVFRTVAVAEKNDVDSTAFSRALKRNHFILAILRIVLPDIESHAVVLAFQFEHHGSLTGVAGRHLLERNLNFGLGFAGSHAEGDPVRLFRDEPVLVGVESDFSCHRGVESRRRGRTDR